MLGALAASLMFLVVKLLKGNAGTFTLVFYRAIVQVILSLIPLVRKGINPFGPPGFVRLMLVLRAAFGAAAVCAWFFGAQVMPLPDAVTLQFTSPPFAAFFAVLVVGEQWKGFDMVGAVVCLTGVALIAHPTWLFGRSSSQANGNTNDSDLLMQALGVTVTTIGAALAGLAYVCVRVIGNRASALVMIFYYGLISIPVSVLGSVLFQGTWNVMVSGDAQSPFTAGDAVLILLIGVLGYMAQWLINVGLQHETAATATLATCTQIVWTYVFELAFLHEALNQWSLGGTALILGYMLVVAVIKLVQTETAPQRGQEVARSESEGSPLLHGQEKGDV